MGDGDGEGLLEKSRLPRTLETARLLLRLPGEEDAEALNRAIVDSHPALRPWMPWAAQPQTLAQTLEFCQESLRKWQAEEALNLLMVEAESGCVVGATGFPRLDWSVPKFEIGYWCVSTFAGRGFVSEAVLCLARHAFRELGAARVALRVDDKNENSFKVAERAGFALEGVLKSAERDNDGGLRDIRIYSATALEMLSDSRRAIASH